MSKELLTALAEPFPDAAIQTRQGGGGKSLDYISTHTVILRLNRCCPSWDFRVTRVEWQNDLCICYGELTIPGLGTRTGIGVQKVSERGGEDLVKGAASDSLKKASTLFGVGLHLYGRDVEGELLAEKAKREDPRIPLLGCLKDEATRLGLSDLLGDDSLKARSKFARQVCVESGRVIPSDAKLTTDDIAFAVENLAKWSLNRKAEAIAQRGAQTDNPTQDVANFLRPDTDDDPPFEGALFAPEPTETVQGGYAEMEASAARMGHADPQGRKNARK